MVDQVVMDTETTGLSRKNDRVIEIGAIKLRNRTPIARFHTYINPEQPISEGARRVHGISSEFLKDKPVFADVYHKMLEFFSGSQLVIHNAPFDMGFLQAELDRQGYAARLDSLCSVLDTLVMAKKAYPGQKNNLDALSHRLGIDTSHRTLHGALKDADLLVKVYLMMTVDQKAFCLKEHNRLEAMTDTGGSCWKEFDLVQRATAQEYALDEIFSDVFG